MDTTREIKKGMSLNINQVDAAKRALAQAIELAHDEIKKVPAVLFCGAEGVGKTTSIRQLFGKSIGTVSSTGRGTQEAAEYPWTLHNQHVRLIDLPGLGGDRDFVEQPKPIYKERLRDTHAVIVLVTPPRPMLQGTIETIECILECGFPPKGITIGYNRLTLLEVDDLEDDQLKQVSVQFAPC